MNTLYRGPVQGQVHGTGDGTSVKPSVSVDTKGLAAELFQMAWFLDRLEENMKPCSLLTLH